MIHTILHLLCLLPVLANQPVDPAHARAEEILRGMSLEQKVGQLMMVGFGGRTMGPEISRLLLNHHIGSVALYSRNIANTEQLARLVADVREAMRDEIQPFVAIDQEGGVVARLRGGCRWRSHGRRRWRPRCWSGWPVRVPARARATNNVRPSGSRRCSRDRRLRVRPWRRGRSRTSRPRCGP